MGGDFNEHQKIFCTNTVDNITLVNVYVDLVVFTHIAGTS